MSKPVSKLERMPDADYTMRRIKVYSGWLEVQQRSLDLEIKMTLDDALKVIEKYSQWIDDLIGSGNKCRRELAIAKGTPSPLDVAIASHTSSGDP